MAEDVRLLLLQVGAVRKVEVPIPPVSIRRLVRLIHVIIRIHIIVIQETVIHAEIVRTLENKLQPYIACFLVYAVPACRLALPEFRELLPSLLVVRPVVPDVGIYLQCVIVSALTEPLEIHPRIGLLPLPGPDVIRHVYVDGHRPTLAIDDAAVLDAERPRERPLGKVVVIGYRAVGVFSPCPGTATAPVQPVGVPISRKGLPQEICAVVAVCRHAVNDGLQAKLPAMATDFLQAFLKRSRKLVILVIIHVPVADLALVKEDAVSQALRCKRGYLRLHILDEPVRVETGAIGKVLKHFSPT